MNVLISIVVSVIVFISIIAIVGFMRFMLNQRLPPGIMPDIIGFAIVVGMMFAFITYGVVSGKVHGPQTAADAYVRLVKAETSEPNEIAEYRKQLYRELGAEILQRKKQIRIEAEENAKKMLAKYREQQTKAKLEAEIAKSRELLKDIDRELLKLDRSKEWHVGDKEPYHSTVYCKPEEWPFYRTFAKALRTLKVKIQNNDFKWDEDLLEEMM